MVNLILLDLNNENQSKSIKSIELSNSIILSNLIRFYIFV